MPDGLFGWTLEEFVKAFILHIVIVTVVTISGLFFKKKIKKFISKQYRKIIDTKTGTVVSFTQKYSEPPTKRFDHDLFDSIKEQFRNDALTIVTLSSNFLKIHSKNLKLRLSISLEEEPRLTSLEEENEIESYNIVISIDNEIIGFKQLDKIQDITDSIVMIQNTIQRKCFTNQEIRQSFAICDISDIFHKPRNEKRDDDNLQARVSFVEHDLSITSMDPQKLAKTVKKYVYA